MASVTSLDKDMRKLRLDRYTPGAAKEVRDWIEAVLQRPLASGDLLDALKDGVALCELANMAISSPKIKFKASNMPFVQMENISHFLRACQSPPLGLQPHDVFLTVDLYESKDPAQVLQCLSAFSRVANRENPSAFPNVIGPKSKAGPPSTNQPGGKVGGGSFGNRNGLGPSVSNASLTSSAYGGRISPVRTGGSTGSVSGRWSPTKLGETAPKSPSVSSWSKKGDQGTTAPAWNIAQYGYMGGANQGNMGVSYGGRRQITSAGPTVPSLGEKEKKRREAKEEAERQLQQMEEADAERRKNRVAEEKKAREEEEDRWAAETQRLRDEERQKSEEERRNWEEDERRWKEEEEARQREEQKAEEELRLRSAKNRVTSDARLQGQFLSQYQASQTSPTRSFSRIEQLERELEEARAREAKYQQERQSRISRHANHVALEAHDMNARLSVNRDESRDRSRSRLGSERKKSSDEAWRESERDYLRAQHAKTHPDHDTLHAQSSIDSMSPEPHGRSATLPSPRPLPDPVKHNLSSQTSTSPILTSPRPPTKPSKPKTLLEREMELERQRQREWEESQRETAKREKAEDGVEGIGGGIGVSHDIGQWSSYTRGDNANKGSLGIGSGRRQIVGPRPMGGPGGGS